LIALTVALVTLGGAPAFADDDCDAVKSLFLNISSERPGTVQVALLVAAVNAGGQSAEIQLFFSNAAAAYAIDTHPQPDGLLTEKQVKKLDQYLHKEFRYRLEDVVRLQGVDEDLNGELPDIWTLQQIPTTRVFACPLCIAEALTAAGVEGVDPFDSTTFAGYLLPGVEPMTPAAFSVIYDRVEEGDPCRDITAAVISF